MYSVKMMNFRIKLSFLSMKKLSFTIVIVFSCKLPFFQSPQNQEKIFSKVRARQIFVNKQQN